MTTNMDIDTLQRRSIWNPDDNSGAPPNDQTTAERDAREAASRRYDEYVSSGEAQPGCPEAEAMDAIPRSVLFLRQGDDPSAIDAQDVHQGGLTDCSLMSTLAGLARSREGRELLEHAIAENRNERGDVVSYTVSLHRPESHWLGLGRTTFADEKITVAATFICGHAIARADGGLSEVWPLVMEKAYAQYRGGYGELGRGGAADAMEVITGRPATRVTLGLFGSYSINQLRSALAEGKIVTFGTAKGIDSDPAAHGLVGGHSYLVTGIEQVGGKPCVSLHNPWNESQPAAVPFEELKKWFGWVSVGSVSQPATPPLATSRPPSYAAGRPPDGRSSHL